MTTLKEARLATLRAANEEHRRAQRAMADAVVGARRAGATWSQIAATMELRKSTTITRYKDLAGLKKKERS